MDYIDAASAMAGRSRLEGSGARHVTNAHAVTGTAMADSSDGTVLVDLGGDVTTGDGSQWVEVQTDAHVLEGDQVDVLLVGEAGRGMSPVIYGVPGGGDRMAASVSNAETLATEAQEVAQATGQHFWHDASGAHVTEATREDWETSQTGPNSLWNSLGMLFRDGLNNLMAILTSGIAIYDGTGNTADHILAEFTADHVRVGGNVPVGEGGGAASVQFFDQTSTHTSHMDASTSIDEQPAESESGAYYDMRNETSITTSLDDDGRVVDTNSNGSASVQLNQWMSYGITDVNKQFSEVTAAIVAHSVYGEEAGTNYPQSDASVEAVATTAADGGLSWIVLNADALQFRVNDYTNVVMRQVLCALLHPCATYMPLVGTWTTGAANAWETAGFGVVVTETGYFTDYIDTANKVVGEFVALVGCTVRVSACVTWADSVAGRRSVGAFVNATRSGSRLSGGTEYSNSGLFYTGNNARTAQLSPLILHLAAGNRLNIGKYAPANAIQSNQSYRMNWVTIEVLAVD